MNLRVLFMKSSLLVRVGKQVWQTIRVIAAVNLIKMNDTIDALENFHSAKSV